VSVAVDLMDGVAGLLAAAGLGTFPVDDIATVPDPITLRKAPAAPDRLITVSHYPITGGGWTTDTEEGIQVRCRTPGEDLRATDELADAIRAALDGHEHAQMGATHVSLIAWQSGASLGQDDAERWEHTQNFHLITARPRAATD